MKVSTILCTDSRGALGFENSLLYQIREDMNYFKRISKGKNYIIMGVKTYWSLPRTAIKRLVQENEFVEVYGISRGKTFSRERSTIETSDGVIFRTFESKELLVDFNRERVYGKNYIDKEALIIGGASLYNNLEELLVSEVHLSLVESKSLFNGEEPLADTFFDLTQLKSFTEVEKIEKHSSVDILKYGKKATP